MKVDTGEFPLKETVNKIIRAFNDDGSSCILAGGWLRDHVYGIEGKDLDFFIQDRNNSSCWMREEGIFELLGFSFESGHKYKWSGREYNNPTLTINIGGAPYQFIFVAYSPKEYVKSRFDYSINQIYYDGEEVVQLPAFKRTLKTKIVSNVYINTMIDGTKRQETLKAKFPNHKFPEIQVPKRKSAQEIYRELYQTQYVYNVNANDYQLQPPPAVVINAA